MIKELGERIRAIRIEKKMSQTELANITGKDQPSINRLENGKVNPSYFYLFEVARGLGVSISDFIEE